MSNIIKLEEIFQRSRARVKGLGEVFTPESYVEQMLDLLAKDKRSFWSDEDLVFFEPSCGHGNIVLPIFRKRLEAFYKKFLIHGAKEAVFYAVANSLNTLWAIDIDFKNVVECRQRVLDATVEFFSEKMNRNSPEDIFKKYDDFFAHVICAINWHIHENETLSALNSSEAVMSANCTKAGSKWFAKNGHRPLQFETTWAKYYEYCESKGATVIQYERALKFLKSITSKSNRGEVSYSDIFGDVGITEKLNRIKDSAAGL